MRSESYYNTPPRRLGVPFLSGVISKNIAIGGILVVALVAFEVFNFDTTRYALDSLLGEANFVGIHWAAILAIAFCAIDFAGLAHLFTPERGREEPKEVWYLMGAWFLGATMNAIMTWWAVSLTLLSTDFGNEVLTRQQLLQYVPIFVAVLVWLTRILFIGAFSLAGEHLFWGDRQSRGRVASAKPAQSLAQPKLQTNHRTPVRERTIKRPAYRQPIRGGVRPAALNASPRRHQY
jgi:hypothetical protein